MPCSCGNTNCPCGVPCCCSEELCKCQTCAIALPRFCKICNKPLISEIQTDEEKCSCFIGESTALILENRNNSQCRMGNIPMPTNYFVSGKLMVNVMIPVPALKCQPFIPPKPICLPALSSIPVNSRKILPSFLSDGDSENPLCPKENSGSLSTAQLHEILDKSNEQSNNHPSNSICSNGEKNINILSEETYPPSGFLQTTDKNQIVSTVQDTESKTKEREDELSTPKLDQILDKSSKPSNNHPSTSISSNGEQNTKLSSEVTQPAPRFSQSTEENQSTNVEQFTKLETEERANIQEPSFYLPSITVDNISYPVNLADPIWRLSNPAFCFEGTSDSSLKLYNPFYVSKKVTTTETMATYEKDCRLCDPSLHFEGKSMQCSTKVDKNVQTNSTISFQMFEYPSNETKISEQSNVINGEYPELANLMNIAVENECIAFPSMINSNTIALPEKYEMTTNSIPDQKLFETSTSPSPSVSPSEVQTQPLCVASTSVSRMNHCLQACSTDGFPHQTLDNVPSAPRNEKLEDKKWNFHYPAFLLPNTSRAQIIQGNSVIVSSSPTFAFQRLFNRCNNTNLDGNNECLPTDHASFVSEMNRKNKDHSILNNSIPLYIDPCTTQKMEKLLKSALER